MPFNPAQPGANKTTQRLFHVKTGYENSSCNVEKLPVGLACRILDYICTHGLLARPCKDRRPENTARQLRQVESNMYTNNMKTSHTVPSPSLTVYGVPQIKLPLSKCLGSMANKSIKTWAGLLLVYPNQ